jgi:hypothetical protein
MAIAPLYVFIDEGGDFNFSPSGSKFYTITATITDCPWELLDEVSTLNHHVLGCGSLPGLGLNTSKNICEQEENDGTCCPPTEDADNDRLRRRDRKPDQSRDT